MVGELGATGAAESLALGLAISEYAPTPTAARITTAAISVLIQERATGAEPQPQASVYSFDSHA